MGDEMRLPRTQNDTFTVPPPSLLLEAVEATWDIAELATVQVGPFSLGHDRVGHAHVAQKRAVRFRPVVAIARGTFLSAASHGVGPDNGVVCPSHSVFHQ